MTTTGGDDIRLDARIEELVERGLDRYGKGDLEGALADWKHVLALDPEHERAADYVTYVEKHYEIRAGVHQPASDPAAELAAPFGIEVPAGLADDDLDAYESIEVDGGRPAVGDGYVDLALDEPLDLERSYEGLEDGWNVDETWSVGLQAARSDPPERADSAGMAEETTSERGSSLAEGDDDSIDIDLEPLGAVQPPGSVEPPQLDIDLEPPDSPESPQLDIDLEPPDNPEPPRRTVLGLGELRDLLPMRPRASSTTPELELELEPVELAQTRPGAAGEGQDEASSSHGPSVEIPIDLDEELTVERGTRSWEGARPKGRAPTQDPAIDVASVQIDDRLLSFEDATGELDIRDLAQRRSVGAAVPVATPPPLPEVAAPDDPDALASQLLAEVDRGAPAAESDADRLRRRVAALFDRAQAEAEAGELRAAVVAAELAVSQQPDSAVVQRALADRSDALVRLFAGFLGDLTRVPEMTMPMGELASADLDHRTAFLLSRVDGTLSLDDLLDVSGMPRIEALRVLSRLVLRGILQIAP